MKKLEPLTKKQLREAAENKTPVRYICTDGDTDYVGLVTKYEGTYCEIIDSNGEGDDFDDLDNFEDNDEIIEYFGDDDYSGIFSAAGGTAKDQLRERLAKFIHEDIWAHWMKYLLEEKAQYMSEDECFAYGQYLIQREDAERWDRQMKTTYEDLPEKEKESDRNLADKLMKLLEED